MPSEIKDSKRHLYICEKYNEYLNTDFNKLCEKNKDIININTKKIINRIINIFILKNEFINGKKDYKKIKSKFNKYEDYIIILTNIFINDNEKYDNSYNFICDLHYTTIG